MNLWKAWLGDWTIGWDSPMRGPVHPRFVPIFDPSGLGWLEGFDELLTHCGLLSNGAPQFDERGKLEYPLHGRIANLPAHRVVVEADAESGEIAVTGVVDECRFHFHKLRLTSTLRTRPGEPGVRIIDEVTNLSASPGEMQLLYHTNFGPPLLEPGSRVVAPVRRMMPRDAVAVPGVGHWDQFGEPFIGDEECYFFQLLSDKDNRTHTLLRNAAGDRGVSLRFSTAELPCFTLWKNPRPKQDGYVTGLEPGTNFPNVRSFEAEQGRVRKLRPGETVRFELALEAHGDKASVAEAERAIARLQSLAPPEICDTPQSDWTPHVPARRAGFSI
jgi:galactose mutarotase-like enzyme